MNSTEQPNTVWISGATQGIGLGLARNVPWDDARIINLSRRDHPDYESHFLDLTDPLSWDAVGQHWRDTLTTQEGGRAWFIQNAHLNGFTGFIGEVSQEDYRLDIAANMTAPIMLAEVFLRAVFESGFSGNAGLIMMTSGSARTPTEAQSVYCAAKAAQEMWVRVARRELVRRGRDNVWVTAVRPGFVDTPGTRNMAKMDDHDYPLASAIAKGFSTGENIFDIDTAGKQIWDALPTDQSLLLFGTQVREKQN